jgi:hypothetical protein
MPLPALLACTLIILCCCTTAGGGAPDAAAPDDDDDDDDDVVAGGKTRGMGGRPPAVLAATPRCVIFRYTAGNSILVDDCTPPITSCLAFIVIPLFVQHGATAIIVFFRAVVVNVATMAAAREEEQVDAAAGVVAANRIIIVNGEKNEEPEVAKGQEQDLKVLSFKKHFKMNWKKWETLFYVSCCTHCSCNVAWTVQGRINIRPQRTSWVVRRILPKPPGSFCANVLSNIYPVVCTIEF